VTTAVLSRRIRTLQDVVDWGLCTGCGVCASACTRNGVTLADVEGVGIRPKFAEQCAGCRRCLSVCPGYSVDARLAAPLQSRTSEDSELGPALEVWEGWATDPEIRFRASSGGLLTALALYCLEREDMAFAVHAGMDPARPWTNRTVQSRNRAQLLEHAGSRYAPAAPGEGLRAIEASDRPCVFIGKPCDTAGAMRLRQERPALDRRLGLVLTFFCAGTPSTRGTLELIDALGVDRSTLRSVRYRGEGWPGRFRVGHGTPPRDASCSYEDSWGRLQRYRPLRCHLCPDGLGRVADLACGDAWEQPPDGRDPGRSLMLVRTLRGREILHRAMAAGYVDLTRVEPAVVLAAQPSLLGRRRELFGRLLAMRLLLVPTPRFSGFSLFRSWTGLRLGRKARTVVGTLGRIVQRGQWRRRAVLASKPA
jgi:coenzyme F420 hydrogenase subunit beta